MEVQQYIFQSPSTNPVQVGRADPASVKSETKSQEQVPQSPERTVQQQSPEFLAQTSGASSINVATSLSNAGVSASLESFSSLNNLAQAKAAFEV